jgi:hypothetical protein
VPERDFAPEPPPLFFTNPTLNECMNPFLPILTYNNTAFFLYLGRRRMKEREREGEREEKRRRGRGRA